MWLMLYYGDLRYFDTQVNTQAGFDALNPKLENPNKSKIRGGNAGNPAERVVLNIDHALFEFVSDFAVRFQIRFDFVQPTSRTEDIDKLARRPGLPLPMAEIILVPMDSDYAKRNLSMFAILWAVGALARPGACAQPTAFDLVREANRYVGEQSKNKVVQIRSEKTIGNLTPAIWYIVLYDPTATLKAEEVKFSAGKMISVKRPMRLLEPVTGGDAPLDRSKLKVDSNEAIKVALKEPLLKDLKITATQLKLERVGEGVLGTSGTGDAVWKVKLWAAKLRQPQKDADIGEVWISAGDGKVVKNDLHINTVD